jgi:hypothetical protein
MIFLRSTGLRRKLCKLLISEPDRIMARDRYRVCRPGPLRPTYQPEIVELYDALLAISPSARVEDISAAIATI